MYNTDILNELSTLSIGDILQIIIFVVAFLFMVFSIIGWIIELFYRRFVSAKKWVNPGFLKGPYLPIYGIGTVILTAYVLLMLPFKGNFPNKIFFDMIIIVGIGILMTLIELIGGLIFIRGMKIRLWDYSDRIGNFKGIICPTFSLIWTVLGALFYYLLFEPIIILITDFISLDWFILAVFMIGIFYGFFIVDLSQSLELGKKVKKAAEEREQKIVLKWENLKIHIQDELKERHEKISFMTPFKSPLKLKDHIESFISKQKDKENNT